MKTLWRRPAFQKIAGYSFAVLVKTASISQTFNQNFAHVSVWSYLKTSLRLYLDHFLLYAPFYGLKKDFIIQNIQSAYVYFFKANNRNIREKCERCSKLTIKAHQSKVKVVDLVPDFVLVSLLLTLNIFHTFLQCFFC